MDCGPPGSSVHGILQARVPEWVAIFFSRASSRATDRTLVSYIGRQILYHWATRGGHKNWQKPLSKSVWQCFLKLNPTTQQFHFWVYTKRNEYLGWTKKLRTRRVHNSIAHNSQKTGNNPNFPQQQNGKEDYSYNRVLTATKKTTNATCCRHTCSKEARHKSTSPEIPFTRSSSTGKTLLWWQNSVTLEWSTASGVLEIFCILMWTEVTQTYMYVKIHCTGHFKICAFIVCKL